MMILQLEMSNIIRKIPTFNSLVSEACSSSSSTSFFFFFPSQTPIHAQHCCSF